MVNFGPNPFSQNSTFQNAKQQTKPDTAFVSIEVPTNAVQIAGNLVGNTGGSDASFSLKVVLSGLSTQKPLTAIESSIFLKNLLNLPQDIQALLLLLASPKGEEKPNSLKKLLEEIPELSLSLEEVQLVLGKESQEGISKLIKLLQTSRTSFAGTETKPEILACQA
ncbi:MAG: hypothetical protein K2X66_05110 [Cyanobacteria bacterium]|nr:hypothetical protein [Cyanobacteriota bacterium]